TSDQLLALLSANRDHQPAFFSYSEKRNQLELIVSVENEAITPRRLREEIRRAATIAESTAGIWRPAGAATNAPSTNVAQKNAAATPNSPASAATPGTSTAKLIGKWSAARSNTQAF